jgi:hypothetical protein
MAKKGFHSIELESPARNEEKITLEGIHKRLLLIENSVYNIEDKLREIKEIERDISLIVGRIALRL